VKKRGAEKQLTREERGEDEDNTNDDGTVSFWVISITHWQNMQEFQRADASTMAQRR
jgi:hypothetical protein